MAQFYKFFIKVNGKMFVIIYLLKVRLKQLANKLQDQSLLLRNFLDSWNVLLITTNFGSIVYCNLNIKSNINIKRCGGYES